VKCAFCISNSFLSRDTDLIYTNLTNANLNKYQYHQTDVNLIIFNIHLVTVCFGDANFIMFNIYFS